MQRLDYNVLVPYLQPKQEYVISISLTDLQKRLYKYYLENYAKAGQVCWWSVERYSWSWTVLFVRLDQTANWREERKEVCSMMFRICPGFGTIPASCSWLSRGKRTRRIWMMRKEV